VVRKLWRSWDDDALLLDQPSGRYLDTAKVRTIDHAGAAFTVRGPLNVPRTPQGEPVLFQAGDSDASRTLGARFADALFTVQRTFADAQAFRRDVHARAERFGRDPSKLLVLPGLLPVIGATEQDAWRRKRELDDLLDMEHEHRRLASLFGVDAERLPLDQPFPSNLLEDWNSTQTKGFAENLLREALKEGWTVRETLWRNPGGHRVVAGAPEQIAGNIAAWFEGHAADGFNLNFDAYPSGLEAFVEHVVPLLRRRGIFRHDYESTTLRGNLGIA
jgi:FMN-dependent oxidoreductase (nitrilotriacetate monooxygenase family)